MASTVPTHAIVHRYSVDPAGDNRSDLWGIFVPKLKAIEGFIGVYTFDDPDRGEGISLTLWDSAEAAQRYVDSADRQELDRRASEFRPATDRRLMKVLAWDDTRFDSESTD